MKHFVCALIIAFTACSCDHTLELKRLKHELGSKETRVKNRAALAAAAIGKDAEPLVPDLILLLRDSNGGVRSSAAYALREIDSDAARAALTDEK